MHFVYHLVDPRNKIVRYVGKTATPTARLRAHIAESRTRRVTRKQRWIGDLIDMGLEPLMIIAAQAPNDAQARVLESRHCYMHLDTIYNIHYPAKGAKDFKATARG